MKFKLALLNFALILFYAGILFATGGALGGGAIVIILASTIIVSIYVHQLYVFKKEKKQFGVNVLLYSAALLVLGDLFLQAFSVSIGMSLFGVLGFYQLHVFIGFILLIVFSWFSYSWIQKVDQIIIRPILLAGFTVFLITCLLGFLGFAGIIPGTVRFIYYAFVFLTFFYLGTHITSILVNRSKEQSENWKGIFVCLLLVFLWIIRWQTPEIIPLGIYRVVVHMGFLGIVVLPAAIFLIKKHHFITAFIIYSIFIDLYFLSYDKGFRYLVNVGSHECVGYDDATEYTVVNDPGVSMEELFRAPEEVEINEVVMEWRNKDFTPDNVKVEYSKRLQNGDSIKVISHDISDRKHYGIVRIPFGINTLNAPIILGLPGGGADIDVAKEEFLYQLSGNSCKDVLKKYISIVPSFRGDIIRGGEYCFRSEGYTGDVWAGAAEDAVSFLEVVKSMYGKSDSSKVLAFGISRGATVALIVKALTNNKVDYSISISTHTNFLNKDAFLKERVGSDFPRVFFTPQASPQNIRKRLIASSPYYFIAKLSSLEIHQGTNDLLTTANHAKLLKQRWLDEGQQDSTIHFYFYEGEGHGNFDDRIVCRSLNAFAK
jgi:hypothetical protein